MSETIESDSPFEMRFDPRTIKHLGVQMYSTLPPAIAEIISNSYDADSEKVTITLTEEDETPVSISIADDGIGLSHGEITNKFLVIGRNRREEEGDKPSAKFKRLPTGKKGLGKLALFGIASTITISTRKGGKLNEFTLDWDSIVNSTDGSYKPTANIVDKDTEEENGTTITLSGLKRKSSFDSSGLADSLCKIFIFDNTFKVSIISPSGDAIFLETAGNTAILKCSLNGMLKNRHSSPRSPFTMECYRAKYILRKHQLPRPCHFEE